MENFENRLKRIERYGIAKSEEKQTDKFREWNSLYAHVDSVVGEN